MNLCKKLIILLLILVPAPYATSSNSNPPVQSATNPSSLAFAGNTLISSGIPVTILTQEKKAVKPQKLTYTKRKTSKGKYYQETGKKLGQCVPATNKIVGKRVVQGWAGNIKPPIPPEKVTAGMVIITREGGGHSAFAYKEDATCLYLHESNYNLDGMETIGRCLPKGSPLIKGGVAI